MASKMDTAMFCARCRSYKTSKASQLLSHLVSEQGEFQNHERLKKRNIKNSTLSYLRSS
jgi:hypothetical protein